MTDTVRTYVLDTSVLLSDPWAVTRFAEHRVVLPIAVISELEGKRNHPELGYFAREALRLLEDLRLRHGRLDGDITVTDVGGTLRVELNHTDQAVLPSGFRDTGNDPGSWRVRSICGPRAPTPCSCPRTSPCGSRRVRWACRPTSTTPRTSC